MQQVLDSFVADQESVDGALIAALDGTLCAHSVRSKQAVESIASLGGKLMVLGDALSGVLKMGDCRNVIAENAQGSVIFMQVTQDLVLVTLTRSKTNLGMLLMVSKRRAEEIATFMNRLGV